MQVACGLHTLAVELGISGARLPFLTARWMDGHQVEIWSRMGLEIGGNLVIPFIDPRRERTRLNELGMRVAFSLMHENTRVVHGDVGHARLAIIQFDDVVDGERKARITYDEGFDL